MSDRHARKETQLTRKGRVVATIFTVVASTLVGVIFFGILVRMAIWAWSGVFN